MTWSLGNDLSASWFLANWLFSRLSSRPHLCPQLHAIWRPALLYQGNYCTVFSLALMFALPFPLQTPSGQTSLSCHVRFCILAPSTESIPFPRVTLLTSSSKPGTSLALCTHHLTYPSCAPMRWVELSLPLYK